MTLSEVATQAGCSESMMSKIENGQVNPSLNLLHQIANALQTNLSTLFDESIFDSIVSRSGERPTIPVDEKQILEQLIPNLPNIMLQANVHVMGYGAGSGEPTTHLGEEIGYVLEGQIEFEVEGRKWTLSVGDSFYLQSERPHTYRNVGETDARLLVVSTPPSF